MAAHLNRSNCSPSHQAPQPFYKSSSLLAAKSNHSAAMDRETCPLFADRDSFLPSSKVTISDELQFHPQKDLIALSEIQRERAI